jgi:hypothetical protein
MVVGVCVGVSVGLMEGMAVGLRTGVEVARGRRGEHAASKIRKKRQEESRDLRWNLFIDGKRGGLPNDNRKGRPSACLFILGTRSLEEMGHNVFTRYFHHG